MGCRGRPLAPVYVNHPRDTAGAGAPVERAVALAEQRPDVGRYVVRYRDREPEWHPAGFARLPYVGDGGAPAGNYRDDLIHLPPGRGVQSDSRPVEEAYFVLQGVLTAGWEPDGEAVETRLGPRDLLLTPAGRPRFFRNDGLEDVQFEMVTGGPDPENAAFKPWTSA